MYRMTVQYGQPDDVEAFESHYFDTHIPLCRALPGVQATRVSKPRALGAGEAPYLIAELEWADAETFKLAMRSPEMTAVGADAEQLAAPRLIFTGEVITD